MHTNHHDQKISPRAALFEERGAHHDWESRIRRYWRKVKRNGGRKIKTLRTHRIGR